MDLTDAPREEADSQKPPASDEPLSASDFVAREKY
jgi:hypothetical protein